MTGDGKYALPAGRLQQPGLRRSDRDPRRGRQILGSYKLRDFLPLEEIGAARRSVSSLWWNENAWFSLIKDDRQSALVTQGGTVRCFDLPTGKIADLNDGERAGIVGLVRVAARVGQEPGPARTRIREIALLGGLRLKDTAPVAKGLFRDKTPTGHASHGELPVAEVYGVQTAAAWLWSECSDAKSSRLSSANTGGELVYEVPVGGNPWKRHVKPDDAFVGAAILPAKGGRREIGRLIGASSW